jgi:signal transduction histidine kinase
MAAAASRRMAILHRDAERAEHLARVLRHAGHLVVPVVDGPPNSLVESLAASSPDLILALSPLDYPLPVTRAALRDRIGRVVPVLGVLRRPEDAVALGPLEDEMEEPVAPPALLRRVHRLLDIWPERARLEQKVQGLTALNRMAWAFSLAGGPSALYGHVARLSTEMVGAEKGLVLLFHPASREMVAESPGHGISAEVIAAVRYPVDGEARERWNFRTNGPLLANDARNDPRILPKLVLLLGLRMLMVAPIRRGSQVLGLLAVANRPGLPFRDEDLQSLEAAANQASVAVENLQLHQRLQQVNVQLQEYDRLKSEFVAMVAHDFRSPLMAIRGFAEVVLDDPHIGADNRREFMRTIIGQTDDLARLAADTFLITQMESAGFRYEWEEIDLERFLRDAVARFSTDRQAFTIDVSPGLPRLHADPERIRQVLTNLLSNAVKYSPEGAPVEIRCRLREPGHILIQVRDHGLGIPADQVGRLFQKFERVRTREHMRVPGSGLGLYICRLIAEGHRGRVWVESEAGQGSTFSLLLPVDPESTTSPLPHPVA